MKNKLDLMFENDFVRVPRPFIRKFNLNTAVMLSEIYVAVKELENYGIIKVNYHGMPKKRYFKFNTVAFNKLYDDFQLNSNGAEEDIETPEALEVPRRNFSGFSF